MREVGDGLPETDRTRAMGHLGIKWLELNGPAARKANPRPEGRGTARRKSPEHRGEEIHFTGDSGRWKRARDRYDAAA